MYICRINIRHLIMNSYGYYYIPIMNQVENKKWKLYGKLLLPRHIVKLLYNILVCLNFYQTNAQANIIAPKINYLRPPRMCAHTCV